MSVLHPPGIPGVSISMGESINLPPGSFTPLSPIKHKRTLSEGCTGAPFVSKLPPAVANVPAEHIRGYVHQKRVNQYLVGKTLGEGSFAKVKEAFHTLVGEKVAMKIIDKKRAQQDPYVAKNFRREAKLLQMVHHTNILQLLEVIETDTSFYLITELCAGGELMNYIYKKGKLDESEARKFMRQIVSAVDHLHKAGIIHRDLKVENMLLDSNGDIKIIDFGLSNEEYIQGENGLVHCNTQCGSPAYAAPELLGHKEYGPDVDIWSIGVNMYAMLTGCLPYTVEPFNITALHAKMLENKMNPIPENLSSNCKDLLRCLLRSSPEERIKMPDIMKHPWMNEGHTLPFGAAPFPNKITVNDIDESIVEHMVHILQLKQSVEELTQELISNRSTSASAVYQLLTSRLARYRKEFQPRQTRSRHRSKKLSRDQGFYDEDDDDVRSTISVPTKKLASRQQQSKMVNVPLRQKTDRKKVRPFSDPEESQPDSGSSRPETTYYRRRMSMPPAILEEDLAKFQQKQHAQETKNYAQSYKANTLPSSKAPRTRANTYTYDTLRSLDRTRRISPNSPPNELHRSRRVSPGSPPHEPYEYDIGNSPPEPLPLAPVQPPPGMRRNYSHSHAINQLRGELRNKLNPPQAQVAWHSNPTTRMSSRNPSRQGSRNPSRPMTRVPSSRTVNEKHVQEQDRNDELIFHQVESHTLPKAGKRNSLHLDQDISPSHLPPLNHHKSPTRTGRRSHSDSIPKRRNGYLLQSDGIEAKTELSADAIMSEVLRVAENMKMREVEQSTHDTVICSCRGVRLQVTVTKDIHSVCRLAFQWLSGGEHSAYKDICDVMTKKLKF